MSDLQITDLLKLNFGIEDIQLSNISLDSEERLLELLDNNRLKFALKNLTGSVSADYKYFADPPLIADIGELSLDLDNTTIHIDADNYFEDGMLQLTLNGFDLEMDPFVMSLDGQSDLSDVVSRLVTFLGNVIRGRLVSLTHYSKTRPKLNNLVNTLLTLIPDEIDIPGTAIYTEGGISDKFHIEEHKYIMIPLDFSIQSHSHPMDEIKNTAQFGPFSEAGYEIQLYLSDYLVESLIWALYY